MASFRKNEGAPGTVLPFLGGSCIKIARDELGFVWYFRSAPNLRSQILKSAIHPMGSFRNFRLTADYADIADAGAWNQRAKRCPPHVTHLTTHEVGFVSQISRTLKSELRNSALFGSRTSDFFRRSDFGLRAFPGCLAFMAGATDEPL
jgi:hypothetical protein